MKIISSAVETVRDVERIYLLMAFERITEHQVEPIFYTTGLSNNFHAIVDDWLSIENPDVRHIEF